MIHRFPLALSRRLFLAASLAALPAALPAQIETEPLALERFIVTATRTATLAEKTAASATVIGHMDIEEAQLTDALAALKSVPGLNVADNGMPGQTAGIFTRGTDSRHTVILLDGHRLPTGAQRYFDLSYFPLVNLDSIEVVRGPFSSTQGGGAVGGVINFISRKEAGDKPEGRIAVEYGSFETQRAEVGVSAGKGGVHASVGVNSFSTDNERDNAEFESISTLNTLGWDISETATLGLIAGFQHRDGGSPGSISFSSLSENLEQDLLFLAPSLNFKIGEAWAHALSYSYAGQETEITGSTSNNQQTEVTTEGAAYQVDFTPNETLALQVGVETNKQKFDYVPIGTSTTPSTALPLIRDERSDAIFAGASVSPIENLTLLGSVRRDVYDDFYGNANTWRYGATYRVKTTGTVLHASNGTAFAAPEVQNFIDYGFGPSATTLKPERSRGHEIGVTQEVGKKLSVGVTGFWNEIDDLVQYVFPAVQNVGRAKTRGVETELIYHPAEKWTLQVGYTYLSARDELKNLPLARRPKHSVSAEIRGEILTDWTAGVGVRGVIDRYDGFPFGPVEDYTVVRIFTQYRVLENLLLKLRVENLLDENYAEVAGYPALPASVHAGIEWRF